MTLSARQCRDPTLPEARLVSMYTKMKMMVRKTRMLPQQITSVTRG